MTPVIGPSSAPSYSACNDGYPDSLEALMTRTIVRAAASIVVAAAAVASAACTSQPAPGAASLTPPFLDTRIAPRPAASAQTVTHGQELYQKNCAQCHGVAGMGDGFGAPFLVPPPRDLTAGQFKFRTTAGGQLNASHRPGNHTTDRMPCCRA